jgi:predicted alpha/beta hydrolase family esterase
MGGNLLFVNMRFLFVPGVQSPTFTLNGWRDDLQEHFSDSEIEFLDDEVYFYTEHKKLHRIVERGIDLLNDEVETIIIAHSFGGILSKAMIAGSEHAHVKQLITMASPHQLNYLAVNLAKRFLQVPLKTQVPAITFGGYFDPIVPFRLSRIGNEEHHDLQCEHLAFLYSATIREEVISYVDYA